MSDNSRFIPFMGIGAPTSEDNKKETAESAMALYTMYSAWTKAGFSEEQAFALVLAVINAAVKKA